MSIGEKLLITVMNDYPSICPKCNHILNEEENKETFEIKISCDNCKSEWVIARRRESVLA